MIKDIIIPIERGCMIFYLFTHTADKAVVGVTDEPSGAKLPVLSKLEMTPPPSLGKWVPLKSIEGGGPPRIMFPEGEIQAEIQKQEYCLLRPEIKVTTTVLPKQWEPPSH